MNTHKSLFRMGSLLVAMLCMLTLTLASCSDDETTGGVPEITAVRLPDATKADSTFTKAGPGQVIAIIGKNLGGAMKVWINDQEVSVNPTLNTDHSIIVTIPTEENGFELTSFNSELKDEIRVETRGGTATYSFKITAPYPQLQRIEASYPRSEGTTMRLYGLNLVDVEQIYITDVQSAALDTTEWTDVPGTHAVVTDFATEVKDHQLNDNNTYVTTSVLRATIPANVPDSGSVVVETAAGTTYMAFYKLPGKPTLRFITNDMPQIGETLIITGTEFVQVQSVSYGDVTLSSDEFTVTATQDSIIVPFSRKPTAGSGTTLTVTTPGGVATATGFYDHSTILTTFDNDDATDNGWVPNAEYIDAGDADGRYAHLSYAGGGSNWWGQMIYFRKDWDGNSFPLSDNIPATAMAKDIYFAYNVYDNNSAFNDGYSEMLRYLIQPIGDAEYSWMSDEKGYSWEDYNAGLINYEHPVCADINDKAYKQKWYRAVVSLDNFDCFKGKTYADIKATGINQFRIQGFNPGMKGGPVDVKIDNVRVVYIPSK